MRICILPSRVRLSPCFAAILLAYLLASSTAFSQSSLGDWKNVQNLDPGTNVVVKTVARDKYFGRLRNVSANSLSIDSDERRFPLPGRTTRRRAIRRADVKEVRLRARTASILVGGAVGSGVGAAIGGAIEASAKSNEDRGVALVILTTLGFAVGAGIGRHVNIVKGRPVYVAASSGSVSPPAEPGADEQ